MSPVPRGSRYRPFATGLTHEVYMASAFDIKCRAAELYEATLIYAATDIHDEATRERQDVIKAAKAFIKEFNEWKKLPP